MLPPDTAVRVRGDRDADDLDLQKRSDRITRRSIGRFVDAVLELADLGLVKAAAEVRTQWVAPMFKVLILNCQELFFGFYDVVPHSISVGGEQVAIFDLMGMDSGPRGTSGDVNYDVALLH